jgi:heme/copper-type cytochrome/quinol oxidase subunit 2
MGDSGGRSVLILGAGTSAVVSIMLIVLYAVSIGDINNSSTHDHFATAQPASDFPIPDSNRMFTNDSSAIHHFVQDPYILDLAQVPKQVVAGEPASFVFNLLDKSGQIWLWHSDMRIAIRDSQGKTLLDIPNNHGHGSVVEVQYVFPSPGKYNIDVIYGQQTGSPNFMIEPKVIREAKFTVNVGSAPVQSISTNSTSKLKEIFMKVESWKFTPNILDVNKGDVVRLHLSTAQDEVELYNGHGFGIEGYNVNAFLLKGTEQVVQFVADKPGTFKFRCTSFCSSPEAALENHFNMIGKLVVHA